MIRRRIRSNNWRWPNRDWLLSRISRRWSKSTTKRFNPNFHDQRIPSLDSDFRWSINKHLNSSQLSTDISKAYSRIYWYRSRFIDLDEYCYKFLDSFWILFRRADRRNDENARKADWWENRIWRTFSKFERVTSFTEEGKKIDEEDDAEDNGDG